MLSNYLAEIWGISIVLVSLAVLINESHLRKLFASLETEDNLFLWGFTSLVIGVAMILAYNVWAWNWHIIITILGWLALLKGLGLLFLPATIKNCAKKMEGKNWLPIALVISVIIGLIITYLGFTA